jgi:phenylpropionate dioxygenase-like ring-hydroxylating dioxygenase large terminal subunit
VSNRVLHDLVRRLHANVRDGTPELADSVLKVPASSYLDAEQWEREIREIFLKKPMLVALSCDIPEPGDYMSFSLAGRPILTVRGDDGRARTFLNICRHRAAQVATDFCGNARRFTCPYHAWSYDRQGRLAGVPGRAQFGEIEAEGLTELPSDERAGAIFAVLTQGAELDLDAWLDGMADALAALRLDTLHPYRKVSVLQSPNWKLTADGYLDGYHLPYLHKDSIGGKIISNGHAYDLFGPHVRLSMATRRIEEIDSVAEADWYLPDYLSVVHFVFPNVSISAAHGHTAMLSRLLPGPTVGESTTIQHQYFRQPLDEEGLRSAEEKRLAYEKVVREEDYATVFSIGASLEALGEGPILYGRNELGNQHLHRMVQAMTGSSRRLKLNPRRG